MTFGQKIQELRKQKKLSQVQLASQLYVTRQSVSQWENDKSMPSIDLLLKLAEVFGTTVDSLLTGSENEETPKPLVQVFTESRFSRILLAMNSEHRAVIHALFGAGIGLLTIGIVVYNTYLSAFGKRIFDAHEQVSNHSIFFWAAGVCALTALFFLLLRVIKVSKASRTSKNGYELQFYQDKISVISMGTEEISMFYSNLKRVTENDLFWIFTMPNNMRFCVSKDELNDPQTEQLLRCTQRYADKRFSGIKPLKMPFCLILCALRDVLFASAFSLIVCYKYLYTLYFVSGAGDNGKIMYLIIPFAVVLSELLLGVILTLFKFRAKRLIFGSLPVAAVLTLVFALSNTMPFYHLQNERVTPEQFTKAMESCGLNVENTIVGRQELFITDCLTASDSRNSFQIMYFNFNQLAENDALASSFECYNSNLVKICATRRTVTMNLYQDLGYNAFYTELTDNSYAYISNNKYTVIYVLAEREEAEKIQKALRALENSFI